MSFIDKAKDLVNKVGADKVNDGIEKAGDVVDDKTGGKYSGQIDQGVDKAQQAVEGMDEGA